MSETFPSMPAWFVHTFWWVVVACVLLLAVYRLICVPNQAHLAVFEQLCDDLEDGLRQPAICRTSYLRGALEFANRQDPGLADWLRGRGQYGDLLAEWLLLVRDDKELDTEQLCEQVRQVLQWARG